jgi:hypothetical protein
MIVKLALIVNKASSFGWIEKCVVQSKNSLRLLKIVRSFSENSVISIKNALLRRKF